MNKVFILALFCIIFLASCHSKDVSNNKNAESISNLESSTVDEKGFITNPYDGINESFQITCQVPDYGKNSEIVLEFSNMSLDETKIGWVIHGNITFIFGNNTTPIHINDYVTVLYYNNDGIVRFGRNTLLDSNSEGKEFVFTKNNLIDGSIHNLIKFKDLEEQVPDIGCIKYFDGIEYKEVFFLKYEDCKPISIEE